MRRPSNRPKRGALPDILLALAASLQEEEDADAALDRLTRGLSNRGLAFALLTQTGGSSGLRVERSTLPLTSEVWGRELRLPLLAAALSRGQPLVLPAAADAFTERTSGRDQHRLWAGGSDGPLVAAPLRLAGGRGALLCLVSPELSEGDRPAVWALALQLGAALRQAAPRPRGPEAAGGAGAAPSASGGEESALFHELTRRLSYSLSGDEVVRAALEVLHPALPFQLAATTVCRDGGDLTTLYASRPPAPAVASAAAADALDAFRRLTGHRHRSCAKPSYEIVELQGGRSSGDALAGQPASVLDAPLVTEGNVIGLLRIASADAFGRAAERTFYTVANQVSLALERMEAQRQAERAHLASLAESLSDGIVLVDADLRVTSLNRVAQERLAEVAGEELREGDSLAGTPLAPLAQEALKTGRLTGAQELLAGGEARRYLMAMAAPLAGSPEGSAAVVILRDVTEERLMQERLLQSEKMASVGRLVSGVAHELNNPLTGIGGFAQLLLARELDERTHREVETIYTEAERASKIVQNLLSFARRKRAEKELADLNALLERVLELRSYDLQVKNIEVELDLDPNLPETLVDADQIQQVFLNIIINAEQAMLAASDRGKLTVRSRAKDGTVRLSFQDSGPGLDPETLRRIFDPFFTTKQTGEGTGLGLTISYGIVEEHGGRIWAESVPGRGTTFVIELPVVAGDERAQEPEEELAPEPAVTGRTILVVDDEESIQRLLGSILAMDGHRVDAARNGLEALERIGRRRYDLVITDIKMPDMDGRSLYRELLSLDKALARRTVFITGDTVSPETRTFLQRVKNPCLAKPFRVREVRETIEQVLGNGA